MINCNFQKPHLVVEGDHPVTKLRISRSYYFSEYKHVINIASTIQSGYSTHMRCSVMNNRLPSRKATSAVGNTSYTSVVISEKGSMIEDNWLTTPSPVFAKECLIKNNMERPTWHHKYISFHTHVCIATTTTVLRIYKKV